MIVHGFQKSILKFQWQNFQVLLTIFTANHLTSLPAILTRFNSFDVSFAPPLKFNTMGIWFYSTVFPLINLLLRWANSMKTERIYIAAEINWANWQGPNPAKKFQRNFTLPWNPTKQRRRDPILVSPDFRDKTSILDRDKKFFEESLGENSRD